MELFYLPVVLLVISQMNIVTGVHSSVSSGDVREYRDISTTDGQKYRDISRLREQTGGRITSNIASSHTNNLGIRPRWMPRFVDRRIFQHPRPGTRSFQTFLQNHQELQNRQNSRPILPQQVARPLVFRPPLNFRQMSPTLRQFDLRKPSRDWHGNRNTLNSPPSVTGTNAPRVDQLKMAEKNSLLTLLEERRSVIRDDNDLILIRKHLIKINSLGSSSGLNQDQILEKQVNYIENITDIDIQREVLKIFVKDIVEKSGFLSQDVSSVHDIDSLKALVDKISSVTDKFTQLSHKIAIDSLSLLGAQTGLNLNELNVALTTRSPSTTTITARAIAPEHVTDSEHSLRQKILNALSIYDNNARVTHTPIEVNDRALGTFQSRQRSNSEPVPGMSIFGDVTTETVTTIENKRGGIESEPLGGDNAYWTHLRAGLVDMLCNLCRQQNRSSCIVRYCSNDLIRTETETPAPSVVITTKQIF